MCHGTMYNIYKNFEKYLGIICLKNAIGITLIKLSWKTIQLGEKSVSQRVLLYSDVVHNDSIY